MAGSYNHAIDDDGNLSSNESFADMIENLGDAYEMAEEMYGMIWYLASTSDDPRAAVEAARSNYKAGVEFASTVEKWRLTP
jgi:hypothetical protein